MKLKRLLSVLIVAAIALALLPVGALAATTPSTWAKTEVDTANVNGLVTPNVSKDFQRELTREEFCELVVTLTEKIVGRELELPSSNPFYDTNSLAVLKAYQYGLRTLGTGIVNGTDVGKFSPDAKVTRQQIAAMMIRAYSMMEIDLGRTLLVAPVPTLSFNDASKIQSYAVDPVKSAVANGMFKGDDRNNFNPANNIRAEESVLVIVRSFEQTQNTLNANATTSTILDRCVNNLNIGYAYGDLQTSVSKDVYLPTSLIGGATVSWTSSNPSVIDTNGRVYANYNASVVLTATIWLSNQTRSKSFTLTTTTLTGNSLLLNNAREALAIEFRTATDTLDNVTNDVFLPTTVLGLPVTWSTSNASVVTTAGRVNVPNDDRTLTATLTGTFYVGSQVGSRTFTLTVRNKNYTAAEVYLHNIKLGMTLSEATSALGSQPKRTVSLTSNETWYTYYTVSSSSTNLVQNFVAVAVQSNRVVGVYTMVNGWESYLRDGTKSSAARLTPSEVNRMSGVSLTTYSDSRSTSSYYAAFLSDDTSTMLDSRTFTVAQLENFLLDLVNAFRGINSVKQITSNSQLLSSARNHSADLTRNDIYNENGTTTNRTFAARASASGYTGTVSGMMAYNQTNPFDYLDDLISTNAYRNTIISSSTTAVGIGASTVTSGYYRNIVTAVFGTGVTNYPITNVTSATNISLNINESRNFTLNITPTNYDENFTVASSNTNVFTVSTTSNPLIVTITGRANGTAYLNVTTDSGRTFQILVTIGTTYATDVTVPTTRYLVEQGRTQQIAATLVPTNATTPIRFTRSSGSGATVSTTGLINAVAASTTDTVISVDALRTASQYTTAKAVSVRIGTLTLSQTATKAMNVNDTFTATATQVGGLTVTWTSSNNNIATVSNGTVTARAAGTATITATASLSTYSGTIVKTFVVSVAATAVDYPTSATLNKNNITVQKGTSDVITVSFTPTDAKNKIVTQDNTDPGITVSVSGANVTVIGNTVGTYTFSIKVQATVGGAVFDLPVTVTVTPSTPNVTISGSTMMDYNGMQTLSASGIPDGAVSEWSIASGSGYADINPSYGNIVGTNTTTSSQTVVVSLYVAATPETTATTATFTITIGPAPEPPPMP